LPYTQADIFLSCNLQRGSFITSLCTATVTEHSGECRRSMR